MFYSEIKEQLPASGKQMTKKYLSDFFMQDLQQDDKLPAR